MSKSPQKKLLSLAALFDSFINNELALKCYLRGFFYRNEDVEDMAQDTFLRAYEYGQSKKVEFPRAFLFQVAKTVALQELRKKSGQLTDYIEESYVVEPDGYHTLEDEVMAEQAVAHYCGAIAELPPQCRRVFLMRKYQGLSHRQIAEVLNISVSAVEQHITLGIKRFKLSFDKVENRSISWLQLASSKEEGLA